MKYKGTTVHAMLQGHPTDKAIAKLLPEFEKATGIKVVIEILPFADMTAKNFLTISQKSDRYDVFMDNWGSGIGYMASGGLEPLDAYINNPATNKYFGGKDFVETYFKHTNYQGTQYGLPVYGESTFLMYRKDLFEQYGIKVPTTMAELMEAAKQVYEKSNKTIYGITLRGSAEQNTSIWPGFLFAFGGRWMTDDDKKVDLYTPEAIAATEFYCEILKKYGPPGYTNFNWMENRVNFTQGKSAMTIDATVNGAFNEDPTQSSVVGKVGYAPVPYVPGVKQKGGQHSLYVHSMYMNKYSKNKEATFMFMSWATSPDIQTRGFALEPNNGITSLTAMNSEAYKKKYGMFLDAMLEALKNANARYSPTVPQANEIWQKVGIAISQVEVDQKTAEQALKEVTEDLNTNVLK
ncbi:MAG: sugar ABC transporter substrate-binding protein [Planctomycetes bacterium]|nr:sugar ABC transporter substrate-binding protein [Planctomycetota bacterium]